MAQDQESVVLPFPSTTKVKRKKQKNYQRWSGGYVRTEADGRTQTYYIAKMINGKRYDLSTRTHALTDAVREFDRFLTDPHSYSGIGCDSMYQSINFDKDLVERFLGWSRDVKENTEDHIRQKRTHLLGRPGGFKGWINILPKDLRRVSLAQHIMPTIEDDTKAVRRKKIIVLKAFFSWLRKEALLLKPAEDPMFGTISVPKIKPAQLTQQRAFSLKQFQAVRAAIDEPIYTHAITVQAGTGWHTSELVRFAKSGKILTGSNGDPILECPRTKAGIVFRTRVSAEVLRSAKLLLTYGLAKRKYEAAICKANKQVGFPPQTVTPGACRHSVATWAIGAGERMEDVSEFLGHRSPKTTGDFYATHETVKKVKTFV